MNKVLGTVSRQFKDLDKEGFLIIYKGYVRPHLEYPIQAWSPYLKGDVNHLEKVQRRAIRLVKGFKKLKYEERLRRLSLTILQQRRLRGNVIETYKIMTGKEKVDRNDFFKLQTRNFHNTSYKPETTRSRLELRRNFFSQRVKVTGINCQRR